MAWLPGSRWDLHHLRLSTYSAPRRSKAGTSSSLGSFHREPLLLGGLSCQDAQCPSSAWSVLSGRLFSQLLSSPLEEVMSRESSSSGKKLLGSFPHGASRRGGRSPSLFCFRGLSWEQEDWKTQP